jgi:hypothetical protein
MLEITKWPPLRLFPFPLLAGVLGMSRKIKWPPFQLYPFPLLTGGHRDATKTKMAAISATGISPFSVLNKNTHEEKVTQSKDWLFFSCQF